MPKPPSQALFPILPLRDIVVFPHMIVPLHVGRASSVGALKAVALGRLDVPILLVTQKDATQDHPGLNGLHSIGTLGAVLQLLEIQDGSVKALVKGLQRARIVRHADNPKLLQAYAETGWERIGEQRVLKELWRTAFYKFAHYAELHEEIPLEVLDAVEQMTDPGEFADTVASHLRLDVALKQRLLECGNVTERLAAVSALLDPEIGVDIS